MGHPPFAFLEEGTVKLNWQQPSNKGKTGKVPKQEIANGISAHPPNTTESRSALDFTFGRS